MTADMPAPVSTFTSTLAAAAADATLKAPVFAVAAPTGVAATDTANIAAKIALAAAGGGSVLLQRGTYLTNQTNLANDVALIGQGFGTTLKLADGNNNKHVVRGNNVSRCLVQNFKVDGNRANQVAGTTSSGVFFTGGDKNVVDRVWVTGSLQQGIAYAGSQYGTISNCWITDTSQAEAKKDIWIGRNVAVPSTGTKIVGNFCLSAGVTIDSDDISVVGNYITAPAPGVSGVYVAPLRRRFRIEGNTCTGCGNYGIDADFSNVDRTYGGVIVGNYCSFNMNGGIGAAVNGTVVASNVCENNANIALSSVEFPQGYPYGILIDGTGIVVSGNVCTDTQATKTQTHGLCIRNLSLVTTGSVVTGNTFDGNLTGALTFGAWGDQGGHKIVANIGYAGGVTGSFGIGTVAPAAGGGSANILHVKAATAAETPEARVENTAVSGAATVNAYGKTAASVVTRAILAANASNIQVGAVTNHALVFLQNNAEKARIGTDGWLRLGSSAGPIVAFGTGTPEGVVAAPVGSTFQRTDGGSGTSLYLKETGAGNTGWVAAGGGILASDPLGLGFVCNGDPRYSAAANTLVASRTYYTKAIGAGSITKVGLNIGVSSGNIAVAVHSGTGVGRAAVVSTQKATTGSIVCPAAGYAEVALTVTVAVGDWFAFSCDNATASFARTSLAGLNTGIAAGFAAIEAVFPPPATPAPSTALFGSAVLLGIA